MSWLSAQEMIRAIRKHADPPTRQAFGGVFSIDRLPFAVPHYPFFMIVNLQAHNLPGSHWVTVFIDEQRRGEIFDSLALPPPQLLMRWLHQFTRSVIRNHLSYQYPLSDTCGAFALYFVFHRLKGPVKFRDCILHNEATVRSFYNTLQ